MTNIIDFHTDERFTNIAYANPTEKEIKEFNKFLKDNKNETVRLYHGTSSKLNILEEGLKPTSKTRRRSIQSSSGFVYLSIYPTMAKTFAEMGYPMESVTVYAIDIPISELKADLDQLANKRMWAEIQVGKTLGESIAIGHGARVKGNIEPYRITKIEL